MTEKTIRNLISLLNDSKESHRRYLENEKKFYFTKIIRIINQNILDLINQNNLNVPLEIQEFILDLKEHLIDWIYLWEKERVRLKPKDSDMFIFVGYKLFPKKVDKILEDYIITISLKD